MNEYEQRMAVLQARFAARCPGDAAALRQAWRARDQPEVRRILHGLAGNAGIFGYHQLSSAARSIEQALELRPGDETIAARLEALIAELESTGSPARP